eukprot:11091732-Karenia_brevis.AAC.1
MIDIVWIGSRSKQRRRFQVATSTTIASFKWQVFANFHGVEIEESEEQWTATHNICTAKGGKVLNDQKTFK